MPINQTPLLHSAPEVFSIKSNETLRFFSNLNSDLQDSEGRICIIDLSNVKHLSVSALMYLAALSREAHFAKKVRQFEYCPPDVTSQSGIKYIESHFPRIRNITSGHNQTGANGKVWLPFSGTPDGTSSGILYGNKVNCAFAKNVVDMAISYGLKSTEALYVILIELMANTIEHAFFEKNDRHDKKNTKSWFFYCEKKLGSSVINFKLLDMGRGIPTTAYKNLTETIEQKLEVTDVDSHIIKDALGNHGHSRSRHKDCNRGKGLPQIATKFKENEFFNMEIYSNRGFADIHESSQGGEKHRSLRDLFSINFLNSMNFEGTLFAWSMRFQNEQGG